MPKPANARPAAKKPRAAATPSSRTASSRAATSATKADKASAPDWFEQPGSIDALCDYIASGGASHNLAAFCRERGLSYTRMLRWLDASTERSQLYARAKEDRADNIADEFAAIADEPIPTTLQGSYDSAAVQDKRVRLDARKWLAAKLAPKRYGEKVAIGGADDLPPVQASVSGEVALSPSDAYMRLIGKA
jgi:hypothetical protein